MTEGPPLRGDYRAAWLKACNAGAVAQLEKQHLERRVRELEEDLRELKRHLCRLLKEREERHRFPEPSP